MALATAVVLAIGLPVAHAVVPIERIGSPPEARVDEAEAQSQRAGTELRRYEDQVEDIRAVQRTEAAGNLVGPDQEMALQRTSQRLDEAEADAASSFEAAKTAIVPPAPSDPGRSPSESPQPEPGSLEARVDQVQDTANHHAERRERATERGSAAGWAETNDLDRLAETAGSLSDEYGGAPARYQDQLRAAVAMQLSDNPKERREGDQAARKAKREYDALAASTTDGTRRLMDYASVRERQALAELEALHTATLAGQHDPSAVEQAKRRLADARADRLGGQQIMSSVRQAADATTILGQSILDPPTARRTLQQSPRARAVVGSSYNPIEPGGIEGWISFEYLLANQALRGSARMLAERKSRAGSAEAEVLGIGQMIADAEPHDGNP
jgi:hypothetical protein